MDAQKSFKNLSTDKTDVNVTQSVERGSEKFNGLINNSQFNSLLESKSRESTFAGNSNNADPYANEDSKPDSIEPIEEETEQATEINDDATRHSSV